jgi:Flp pilus assembly protein TadG
VSKRADDGAAVVEFTLVTILLVAVFLAILQLALVLYVRNTLVAAAAEGARYAANADRSAADGAARTRYLAAASLGPRFADDIQVDRTVVDGVPAVVVEVRATLPLIGLAGPSRALVVRGHALDEEG